MFFCGGVIECAFQEVNSNIILYWKCTSKYHPICVFDYLQHHHVMVGYIYYLPAWDVVHTALHQSRWRIKRIIIVQIFWHYLHWWWSMSKIFQSDLSWTCEVRYHFSLNLNQSKVRARFPAHPPFRPVYRTSCFWTSHFSAYLKHARFRLTLQEIHT